MRRLHAVEAAGDWDWKRAAERAFCLPMMLVANAAIVVYFRAVCLALKHRRRVDVRVALLRVGALGSFASLVGFAHMGDRVLRRMNDVSEACVALAFLAHVTIIASDARKHCSLRSLRYFSRSAECLCGLALASVALSGAALAHEQAVASSWALTAFVEWHETAALLFIVSFRFYYITLSRGSLATLLQQQPIETLLHVALAAHAVPFLVAKHCTGVALDFFQGLCFRSLVLLCTWATTRDKRASDESRRIRSARRARRHLTGSILRQSNPKLSSIMPQTSSFTTHRPSARHSHATLHSLKRVYRQQLPSASVLPQPQLPAPRHRHSATARPVSSADTVSLGG